MARLRIVVFGASGQVGRRFVTLAANERHEVMAVHRGDSSLRSPLQEGVECRMLQDFNSAEAIGRLVAGADVVVSCLGLRRAVPLNPWSRLVSPANLMERFSGALLEAMDRQAVRRLVVVSAAGVGSSADSLHPAMAWLFRHSKIGVAYADLGVMEAKVSGSALDYTVVRPVTLLNFGSRGRVRIIQRFGLLNVVSRKDVAAFLLHCVEYPDGIPGRLPMIAR